MRCKSNAFIFSLFTFQIFAKSQVDHKVFRKMVSLVLFVCDLLLMLVMVWLCYIGWE